MLKKQIISKIGTNQTYFKTGKPLVVFLSGWDSFATNQVFYPVIDRLDSSLGILTFDYLNTDESGMAKQNYVINEQVAELAHYIQKLNAERIIIVVHSIGGILGLRLARQLNNVMGIVSIEPTTKEVVINPPHDESYAKMLHQYDGISKDEIEKMLKQKVNDCFEPKLAKAIWSTYQKASQTQPSYDCTDFPAAISNNPEFKVDDQVKSIIFTEPFRKAEFERSEYHNQNNKVISMGNDHYLYWAYPDQITKAINDLANY